MRDLTMTPEQADRFWAKVAMVEGGCWTWTASAQPGGYGQFNVSGRPERAHRLAYVALVGPIPEGLVLDHLCRNPACVNPEHIEAVTVLENTMRGQMPVVTHERHLTRTTCPRGHHYNESNTARSTNARGYPLRYCRTCKRDRRRLQLQGIRAAKVAS